MELVNRNILIVLKDNSLSRLVELYLADEKCSIRTVEEFSDSFDIIEKDQIDLVITNYSEGYKEFHSLRNDKFKNLPFLFIVQPNEQVDQLYLLKESAEDFINFPLDEAELKFKMNSLIKRSDIFKAFVKKADEQKQVIAEANKVLLVDDDLKLSKLFEYNLSKAGFEVKVAHNGLDALSVISKYTPDIIVCDIMMPEMDGYQFRRELLEHPVYKEIPFVFLTAKGEESDILDGYDLEIEDYIIKTSGPRVVVAKVGAILKTLDKERKKMVSEINKAADSFRAKVVPDEFPVFEGFDIKHWHQPYKGIPGGDFIDYFQLDQDNLVIVLGDVMGKKWGAWYFAFAYAGYVRSAIRVVLQSANEFSPCTLLQRINESVYQDAKVSEVFATLSIVIVDKKNKIAKYSGAGDLPVVYKNSQLGNVEQKSSKGMLLGFMAEGGYSDVAIPLNPGDYLVLHSDGIIESRDLNGEQFGSERLKKTLAELPVQDAFIDAIKQELTSFTNDNFEDDISLVTIKVC
jgi:sigma-B regulation protein RsbU (phosphoserine phosphatase)